MTGKVVKSVKTSFLMFFLSFLSILHPSSFFSTSSVPCFLCCLFSEKVSVLKYQEINISEPIIVRPSCDFTSFSYIGSNSRGSLPPLPPPPLLPSLHMAVGRSSTPYMGFHSHCLKPSDWLSLCRHLGFVA